MLLCYLDEYDCVDEAMAEMALAPFKKLGYEIRRYGKADYMEKGLAALLEGADLAYCIGNPDFTDEVFEKCPNLKLIQRAGIGVNSIDLPSATRHGVIVYNTVGYCIEELAVHATALALDNIRTITAYDSAIRAGGWPKGEGRLPRRVSKLTIGLFGLGGSGRYMAQIWHDGFGARVLTCDPYVTPEAANEAHATLVDFETLCRESDVISIHAPLTAETRHTFSTAAFDMMKETAIIVNVTRGGLIDFAALTEALQKGKIAAAGIDTFESEPLPKDDPLLSMTEKTVLTPHSAFAGKEADETWLMLASTLPVKAFEEKTIYSCYLANKDYLARCEEMGFSVCRDRLN